MALQQLRQVGARPRPPPPSRTKWTRLVHAAVLIGHVDVGAGRRWVPARAAAKLVKLVKAAADARGVPARARARAALARGRGGGPAR